METSIIFSTLEAEMVKRDITVADLAKRVHVDCKTMVGKLSGKYRIDLNEAFMIREEFFPECSIWDLFYELTQEVVP